MTSEIFKENQIERTEPKESPESFLEKMKIRDDAALILLKGGDLGGLNPDVKTKIIDRLSQWFEVIEGEKHNPTFEEIAVRWGGAGLQYQFRKMENNPDFEKEFIDEGRKFVAEKDKDGFSQWLSDARNISENDPGLLRQELMLDYFSKTGQSLMLKLKEGLSRETILRDLNLTNRESLVQAVGEKRADLDWADSKAVNFQDFIKRIVVGETASYKATPGTVRHIIAQELQEGALKEVMEKAMALKGKNQKAWRVESGDYNSPKDDEETVISTFLNAVHSVDLSLDEFRLMSESEIKQFVAFLEKEIRPEKRDLKAIEFNLEQGIKNSIDQIKKISETKEGGELVVVCIAGGSSSGKTSGVLNKLTEGLGEDALAISMDNYYKGRAFMKGLEKDAVDIKPGVEFLDTERAENWDQPQALDLKLLAHHLNELKQGKKIESPKYEMNGSYRSNETILIDPSGKKVIVVEGLFALNDQIVKFANPDYKIYVGSATEDDDVHGRIIRRLIRDPQRTGLGEKDIFKYWVDVIEPLHREYIAPTKEVADIIINNEYNPVTEAKKAVKLEVQTKYRLAENELQDLLNKLEKSGAKIRDNFSQVDEYLVMPGHDPKNIDELLRIRQEEGRYFITYKGPVEKDIEEFRVKSKIDFELTPNISQEEVLKLREVLQNFGYRTLETITKQRKVYELSGIEIAIDDVGEIGKFIEIRADTKEEIRKLEELLKNLGLSEKKRINEPYIELSLNKRGK